MQVLLSMGIALRYQMSASLAMLALNRLSQSRTMHFRASTFMAYERHRFGTAMAHAGSGALQREDALPI